MESIIATIITGFFSLAGIWYQNYLSKKAIIAEQFDDGVKKLGKGNPEVLHNTAQTNKRGLGIFFTILIAAFPWVLFRLLLPYISYQRFGDEAGRESVMMLYYTIWFFITMIAILIGWKRKTIFEKIILAGSLFCLLFTLWELYKAMGWPH